MGVDGFRELPLHLGPGLGQPGSAAAINLQAGLPAAVGAVADRPFAVATAGHARPTHNTASNTSTASISTSSRR